MEFDDVDESALVANLRRAVDSTIRSLDRVASSSNLIYRAETRDAVLCVRIPRLERRAFSAFWQQMDAIYGHDFTARSASPRWVTDALLRADVVDVPVQVGSLEVNGRVGSVVTWIEGDRWDPDVFPKQADVNFTLGDLLGRMHSEGFGGFGASPGSLVARERFVTTVERSVRNTLERYWREPGTERRFDTLMESVEVDAVASTCALIMADLSANQFVYRGGTLGAVVDLDAYVIGPVEFELTLAEWCVSDPEAFRSGYERHRALPTFARFRTFHRFTMLVNEPGRGPEELDRALSEAAWFK